MKITDVSINRSVTIFTLMIFVVIMGITSYVKLPREASPDVEIPYVIVTVPYFGTSPSDMEILVTRKLEQQLKGLGDLKTMSSTSNEGISTVVLEFNTGIEMSDALQKVRDAVEMAKPDLPEDVRDDVIIRELSSDDWPVMQVVLSGDYGLLELRRAGEKLQEELERIEGVLSVDMSGGVEQEVDVTVDPDKLVYYNLGIKDVKDCISMENVNIPGGEISLGIYDYEVRTPGEFKNVDEISDLLVNPGERNPVFMRDIADVSFSLADRETMSRLNGVDAVTLTVKKQSGENIIRIADDVEKTIARMKSVLPSGTDISITNDMSVYIRDIVGELENNILSGLILVVGVIFLFLGVRNSIFIALAIPFSMLISFIVLSAMDITLNMTVLFALILALGMLVDNAIVIVENIYRHRMKGMSNVEAAKIGTDQVSAAVIASTLTTLCAFAPLLFWPGIMGEFMKYLPLTVVITLLASLFVALVFNPVLCANYMVVPSGDKKKTKSRPGDRLLNAGLRLYEPLLRKALKHNWLTIGGLFSFLLLIIFLFGVFSAGIEFFPDTEPTHASVILECPSGTRLGVTDTYTRTIEDAVETMPDLRSVVSEVGRKSSGSHLSPGTSSKNFATISVEFLEKEFRHSNTRESIASLRKKLANFTGGNITINKQQMGPPTGKPVNIEVSGDDFSILGKLALEIEDQIRDLNGLVDLKNDYDKGRPEIIIHPDPEKMARLGFRIRDVAGLIRTAVHGSKVSSFRVGEDDYDIIVKIASSTTEPVEDLENLTVFHKGEHIPLTAFAVVSYGTGYGSINRIDSKRVVTVSADAAEGVNGNELLSRVREKLSGFPLPDGYHLDFTGENKDAEEAQEFLGRAFEIALMLILLVLITQFSSISVPIVIMFSVLLSLIGVFMGLLVTGTPFGIIMTGVGVISLAGVVVNNAIVLLDYVIKLRNRGMDKREAIVKAGMTRFRPVMLTAITTILGLIPLTTGFSIDFDRLFSGDPLHMFIVGGQSSEWWGPMGTAIIWGLTVATFLTLVAVPVMYSSIDSIKNTFKLIFLELPLKPFGKKIRN